MALDGLKLQPTSQGCFEYQSLACCVVHWSRAAVGTMSAQARAPNKTSRFMIWNYLADRFASMLNDSKRASALSLPPTVREARTARSHGGRCLPLTSLRSSCHCLPSAL